MGCGSSQQGDGSLPVQRDLKRLKQQLQKEVGKNPDIDLTDFENWGKNIRYKQIFSCAPKTLKELQAVVRACRKFAVRVRAVGSKHSWAPTFGDEGSMILGMRELKREDGDQILLVQDPKDPHAPKRVSVMTGCTTGELMAFEVSHGVCLPTNVILTDVTLGGVVGPICHGVGRDNQTVCDYIWGMRIVNSDGDLVEYNKDKDPEMMKAVQGNFGLFGIIYDITFDMQPMVIVKTINDFEHTVQDVFYDKKYLKKLLDENHSVEIFWYPFSGMSKKETFESLIEAEIDDGEWDVKLDKCWMRIINPEQNAGKVAPQSYYDWENFVAWWDKALFKVAGDPIGFGENERLTPSFMKFQFGRVKQTFEPEIIQHLPHAIHYREYIHQSFKVDNMEWAIPLDKNYDVIRKAMYPLFDMINKRAQDGKFPLSLVGEMRIQADSDIYLSPARFSRKDEGGTGLTLYVEILSFSDTPGWAELCKDLAQVWMKLPGARIHWAKYWPDLPNFKATLRDHYKATIPKFLQQLDKSGADPDGIFYSGNLEEILVPGGHPGWKKRIQQLQQQQQQSS